MSKEQKSDTAKETSQKSGLVRSIQSTLDQEAKQGFRGTEVDSTPNENYTVQGVISGAPTPETDLGAAKQARQDTGLGLSALEAEAKNKGGK